MKNLGLTIILSVAVILLASATIMNSITLDRFKKIAQADTSWKDGGQFITLEHEWVYIGRLDRDFDDGFVCAKCGMSRPWARKSREGCSRKKEAQSALEKRLLTRWMDFGGKGKYAIPALKSNIKDRALHWKKVALDVDRVEVSKTIDTGEYVITFVNGRGEVASLWLDGNKVRSISGY